MRCTGSARLVPSERGESERPRHAARLPNRSNSGVSVRRQALGVRSAAPAAASLHGECSTQAASPLSIAAAGAAAQQVVAAQQDQQQRRAGSSISAGNRAQPCAAAVPGTPASDDMFQPWSRPAPQGSWSLETRRYRRSGRRRVRTVAPARKSRQAGAAPGTTQGEVPPSPRPGAALALRRSLRCGVFAVTGVGIRVRTTDE